MRVQSLLALLAVSVAYAAPIAEADAVAVADEASYAPKPTYGSPKDVNPFEIISDAALTLLKWKLALIKEGAKIILSPFEKAYNDKYHPEPAYPPGYTPKSYPRDADYAPAPKYEPKPTYGSPKDVNPFEIISDAALALLKWKLALIKEGAKIILSPFEQAYNDKYHPEPAYPEGYKPKSYPREADAEADYAPKPYKAPKGDDLLDGLSEAAIELLKFKLALIKAGFKIILSPLEKAFDDKYHPTPAPYAGPKPYYG